LECEHDAPGDRRAASRQPGAGPAGHDRNLRLGGDADHGLDLGRRRRPDHGQRHPRIGIVRPVPAVGVHRIGIGDDGLGRQSVGEGGDNVHGVLGPFVRVGDDDVTRITSAAVGRQYCGSMAAASDSPPASCVLGRAGADRVAVVDLDAGGSVVERTDLAEAELPEFVRAREAESPETEPRGSGTRESGRTPPRWVFSDTPKWYPPLLAAGVSIDRCHDLRLAHAILARSELVGAPDPIRAAEDWDAEPVDDSAAEAAALFEVDAGRGHVRQVPHDIEAGLAESARQRTAVETASDPGRLRLLLAAESAGGLVAAELRAAGVPWDVVEHDRILTEALGPRPLRDGKPAKMLAVADRVRAALSDPHANLDSPNRLLSALRNAGIHVDSTSKWELAGSDHPAIAPL